MWRTVSSELRSLAQRRSALKPSGSVAGGIALRDQTLTFTQLSPTSSLIQKAASLFTYQANDILRKSVEEVAPSPEPKRQNECRAMLPETMSVLGYMVGMPQHLQSLRKFQQSGGSIKALDYWRLHATLKDVSTMTRADEANYQFVNHFSSEKELTGSEPTSMRLSRPLSPHLPVYVPQRNSLVSIFNRIAAAFLAGEILFVYLLVKMGAVSMTNFYFYDILFNVSKLSLISAEISALALFYHVLATFLH